MAGTLAAAMDVASTKESPILGIVQGDFSTVAPLSKPGGVLQSFRDSATSGASVLSIPLLPLSIAVAVVVAVVVFIKKRKRSKKVSLRGKF